MTHGKKATPPCKCGYLGHPNNKCRCTPDQVAHYRNRISGPLIDRIDLRVDVPALVESDFERQAKGEATATVRERVSRARAVQLTRQGCANARIADAQVETHATPDAEGRRLLRRAMAQLHLSGRARHRVLRVARTAADLEGSERVRKVHVAEALHYR